MMTPLTIAALTLLAPSFDPEIGRSTVGLQIFDDTGESAYCTGTLIGQDQVLTAAHCVQEIAGIKILFGPDGRAPLHERWATHATHPKKAFPIIPRDRHDVALLYFEGGIPAGFKAAPILPAAHQLVAGERVEIAGYGVTEIGREDDGVLRQKVLTVLDPNYSSMEITLKQGTTWQTSSCPGDSGGPAYVQKGGTYFVWGVANAGIGVEKPCGQYIIYADIRNPDLKAQIGEVRQPLRVVKPAR